jgi:AbrB family looped-hinge helix DNA binding protein
MNARAKISSKGQLVLPKAVRDARGWGVGTELEIIDEGADVIVRLAKKIDPRFPSISWDEFEKRRIRYEGPSVSINEMNRSVLEKAKRRWNEESR